MALDWASKHEVKGDPHDDSLKVIESTCTTNELFSLTKDELFHESKVSQCLPYSPIIFPSLFIAAQVTADFFLLFFVISGQSVLITRVEIH